MFFDIGAIQRNAGAFAGSPVGTMSNFIPGALPWNPTPSPPPTSMAGLNANYAGEYQKSMAFNQANYNNVLSGYQNLIAQQNAGYQQLYSTVMSQLQGAETSRRTEIGDMARSELGVETQGMINRGLGNTTVQNAVASGVEANKQRRLTEVANEFAQMRAGYQQQLGQAQLGNLAGLSKAQLDFMTGVNGGYPDAGMYGQLAQMFGSGQGGYEKGRGPGYTGPSAPYGGMGLGGPRLGYTPSPTPYFGGTGYSPGPIATGGGYNFMASQGAGSNWNTPSWDNSGYFGSPYGGMAAAAYPQADYGGMAGSYGGGDYSGIFSSYFG